MNKKSTKQFSFKSLLKGVGRTMLVIMTVLAGLIIICIGLLWISSPGRPKPFLDQNGKPLAGSISEKVFVNIGGVRQGMFIRSKNINNPVLLFVHGGPCFSEYFLTEKYPTGLEDDFTVCYWEQRGGGLSYDPDIPFESITMEQLTSDVIDVTNYLRNRFDKEKIYLMAHSGGTTFAIQAASVSPELFHAYIGVAQITKQAESEKLAYKYMLEQYKAAGNTKMVEKLMKYPILDDASYIIPFYKSPVRDQAMHELGVGTMHNMKSILTGIFLPVMSCKAYTFGEKINIWASKFSYIRKTEIIDQLFDTDIAAKVPELKIPVYFFSGAFDLTVNNELSKGYLNQLKAPVKGFYTFYQSAHSPIFEEPEKVMKVIHEDVLNGKNDLADTDN